LQSHIRLRQLVFIVLLQQQLKTKATPKLFLLMHHEMTQDFSIRDGGFPHPMFFTTIKSTTE